MFAGGTPLPLPLAGAALASVKILQAERGRREKLFANTDRLRGALQSGGWEMVETPGPIVRLPVMPDAAAARLRRRLLAAGIYPPFIQYGKVPGAFRFVISSGHTAGQLDRLVKILSDFKMETR
jgi:7-keto-8-aminopelargonate synthetase-like enzyme